MLFKLTATALGAFTVAVSSLVVTPIDNQPAPINNKPRSDDDGSLQTRANVQFSRGYTLCSWFVSDPWGGQGGSYTEILVAAGDKEIGCVEMDNSPRVPSTDYDGGSFFNIWNVCGMDINFYNKNGNWDFYENGGDGTLLGTCYPHDGVDHYCLQGANGGSCTPETIMKCYASGFAWTPCT